MVVREWWRAPDSGTNGSILGAPGSEFEWIPRKAVGELFETHLEAR
jgi:hypothetical protein